MKSCFGIRVSAWALFALGLFLILPASAKPPKIRDIYDTAAANPILTKFTAMVQAAELGTFLSSRGPFTVFAPTDSAFARLKPGEFEALLQPQNKERLQDIVLFHVVSMRRLSAKDMLTLKTIPSSQGGPLTFRTTRLGTQLVMKAKVTHADIRCANGIINQVDALLMPPETALPPLVEAPVAAPAASTTNAVTPITNAAPADTNAPSDIPVAPAAAPEVSPH
jgi:uncharacterized surface protein with fasciclin (FAS1) repeats